MLEIALISNEIFSETLNRILAILHSLSELKLKDLLFKDSWWEIYMFKNSFCYSERKF